MVDSIVIDYGTDHSKNRTIRKQTLKRSVFEWIWFLSVQYSSPHFSCLNNNHLAYNLNLRLLVNINIKSKVVDIQVIIYQMSSEHQCSVFKKVPVFKWWLTIMFPLFSKLFYDEYPNDHNLLIGQTRNC